MRRLLAILCVVAMVLAACGGSDGTDTDTGGSDDTTAANAGGSEDTTDSGDGGGGAESVGSVIDPQPPGQAKATVDGLEYTFTDPGGLDCRIGEEDFNFSFIIGDNEVTVGGGGFRSDDGWMANPELRIADPGTEPGPIGYFFPDIAAVTVAIDGQSMSLSGDMQKQPANDGSNPPPVDVGEGVITYTCP